MFYLKVKRKVPEAKLPVRAYNSAGYDLYPLESGEILPGEKKQVRTGIITEFPTGYVGVIDDRGSVGNAGLTHLAGVIDADYRDEWILIMLNASKETYKYSPLKALAQVLFLKVESCTVEEVTELTLTERGEGKFGSSGH